METLIGAERFRVYYNRWQAAPLVWCVTPDASREWEFAVSKVFINTACETIYNFKETDDDEDGLPSAWILAEGYLKIADGVAYIDGVATP